MSALLRRSSMCKEARRVCIAQSLPAPRSRRRGYGNRRDVIDPTPPPDPRLSLSGPARLSARRQLDLPTMCKEAHRVRIAQSLPSPRSRCCGYGKRLSVLDPTPPPDPWLSLPGPARLFSAQATRPSDHVQRGAPGSQPSASLVGDG